MAESERMQNSLSLAGRLGSSVVRWTGANRGLAAVALLSFVVTVVLSLLGSIVWYGDSATFFQYADGLQHGSFYPNLYWRSPAYPLAILATGTVGGLLLLQAFLAFLMPLLVYGALSPFSRRAAFAAGLLSVLSLTPWIFFKTIYQDQLFAFGLVLIAFLLARLATARSTIWIVYSLAFAFIFFGWVRPTIYAGLPIALVILLWRRENLLHAQLAVVLVLAANMAMDTWKAHSNAAISSSGRQLFYNAYLWSDGISFASPAGQELRTRWIAFLDSDVGHLQDYHEVYAMTEQEYQDLFARRIGNSEAFVDYAVSHPHVAYYSALWRAMDYDLTRYGAKWDPLLARVSAEEAMSDPGLFGARLAAGYKSYVLGPGWRFLGAKDRHPEGPQFDAIGEQGAILGPERFSKRKVDAKWLAARSPTDLERTANHTITGVYVWLMPACYLLMFIGAAGFIHRPGPLRLVAVGVFALHSLQALGLALLVDPQSRYQMGILPLAVLGAGFGILRIALWVGALAPRATWLQREKLLMPTHWPERPVSGPSRRPWPTVVLREFWPALAVLVVGLIALAPLPKAVQPLAPVTTQRVNDLHAVEVALRAYAAAHGGRYPVSEGWQGYASAWGKSAGPDWIPELTGDYIPSLPRDPAMSEKPDGPQYIYSSDGRSFKLIVHVPGDCSAAVESHGVERDPRRMDNVNGCWAYGVWSPGGEAR